MVSNTFGSKLIWSDYSTHRSHQVFRHMNDSNPPEPKKLALAAIGACALLSGHVRAEKYVAAFGLRSTVTLLRPPLERLLSEYNHHSRDNYNGTLLQYMKLKKKQDSHIGDRYAFLLSADKIPIQAYGFVGLTDRYEQTIELFNHAFGTKMALSTRNEGVWDWPADASDLDEELKRDNELYETALATFVERQRIMRACKPYAHGAIDSVDVDVVWGWAWWATSDDAVSVRVLMDGIEMGRTLAAIPHRMLEFGAPRGGFVGFAYPFPVADHQRTVRCESAETGQLFAEMVVPAADTVQ